eukprot:1139540-Pelagomonas_calceolata.AAC.3
MFVVGTYAAGARPKQHGKHLLKRGFYMLWVCHRLQPKHSLGTAEDRVEGSREARATHDVQTFK